MPSINTSPAYMILDTETSCLNRGRTKDRGMLFEIAAMLLDAEMKPIASFESLIAPTEEISEDNSEQPALNMHMRSGLFAEIDAADPVLIAFDAVKARFYTWLIANGVEEKPRSIVMIGNTPAFDRAFTERLFPEMERFLHYRMIDVSCLREVAAYVTGMGTERLKLAMQTDDGIKHRAMGDVKFCFAELKCYTWMMAAGKNALMSDFKARGLIA